MNDGYSILISYHYLDFFIARTLFLELEKRDHHPVMKPSEDVWWFENLDVNGLSPAAEHFILLLTPSSMKAPILRKEFTVAQQRGLNIIVVLADEASKEQFEQSSVWPHLQIGEYRVLTLTPEFYNSAINRLASFFELSMREQQINHTTADGIWIDEKRGVVLRDGQPISDLTDLEYRLLILLYSNAGKVLTKQEIVTGVWNEEFRDKDEARIEKLMSRLRAKLEFDPANPRFLQTLRGRGYRFVTQ